MSNIDHQIVKLDFDGQQFEIGVGKTLSWLDKLKESLNFDGMSSPFDNLSKGAADIDLSGANSGIEALTDRFSTMGIVGMTVVQELTKSAIDMGKKLWDMSLGQAIKGGKARAKNLEQARFMFQGLGVDAEKALESANKSVLGTMFGFDAAAKAGSQFAAAGVDVGENLYTALRGVAGVASMTGSEFEDIARIFTTVAGNGRLMGDQLNRLGIRGLNVAAVIATSMGKTEAEVRGMVSKGQISFNDFSQAMYDAFGEHAVNASGLFSGAVAHAKAALSRIGGTFAPIIYDNMRDVLLELRFAIDKFHNILKPLLPGVERVANAVGANLVSMLRGFDATTITPIINGLVNVFKALWTVVRTVGEAFLNVFPPIMANNILTLTERFEVFTRKLILTEKSAAGLRKVFELIFTVIKGVVAVAGQLAKVAIGIVEALLPIGKAILQITGVFANFIKQVLEVVANLFVFRNAGKVLDFVLLVITDSLQIIANVLGLLSDAFDIALGWILKGIQNLAGLAEQLGITQVASKVLTGALIVIKGALQQLGKIIIPILAILIGFTAEIIRLGKLGFEWLSTNIIPRLIDGFYRLEIVLSKIWNTIRNLFTNSIGSIASTIGGMGTAIYASISDIRSWSDVSSKWNSAISKVGQGLSNLKTGLTKSIKGIKDWVSQGNILKRSVEGIRTIINNLGETFRTKLKHINDWISSNEALQKVLRPLQTATNNVRDAIINKVDALKKWVRENETAQKIMKPFAVMIDGIKAAFSKLGEVLVIVLNKLRPLGEFIYEKIAISIDWLVLSLTNLFRAESPIRTFANNVINTFIKMYEAMAPFVVDKIYPVLQRFFGWIIDKAILVKDGIVNLFSKDIDSGSSGLQKFIEVIKHLWEITEEAIKSLGKLSASIGSMVFDKVTGFFSGSFFQKDGLADDVMQLGFGLTKAMKEDTTQATHVMKDFGEKLKEHLGTSIGIQDLFNLGLVVALFKLYRNIKKAITKPMVNIMRSFDNVLGSIRSTLLEYQKKIKAQSMVTIATAIAILAGAIVALSFADPQSALIGLSVISILLFELIYVTKLMDKVKLTNAKQIVVTLLAFSVVVGAMTSAIMKFKKFDDVTQALVAIGGVAVMMVGVAGLLYVMSKALEKVKAKEMLVAMAGIYILSTAMGKIAKAFTSLSTLDTKGITSSLIGFGSIILGLMVLINTIDGKKISKDLIAIAGIAASVYILQLAIKKLGEIEWDTLKQGLATTAGILVGLGIFMRVIASQDYTKAGVALLGLATSIVLLIAPITILGLMPKGIFNKGMNNLLAVSFVTLGMITLLSLIRMQQTHILGAATAMIGLAAAINLLILPITLLGLIPFKVAFNGITIMFTAFLALAGMVGIFTLVADSLSKFSMSMLATGAGIFMVAAGMTLVVGMIGALASLGVGGIFVFVSTFVATFLYLVAQVPKIIKALVAALEASAPSIIQGLNLLIDIICNVIIASAGKIVDTLGVLIWEVGRGLIELIAKLMVVLWPLIVEWVPKIWEFIKQSFDAMLLKFYEISAQFGEWVVGLFVGMINAIGTFGEKIYDAGADLINGLIRGIVSTFLKIDEAIKDLGKRILGGIKSFFGIKSPSTEMAQVGTDMIQGLINGTGNMAASAVKGITSLAGGMLDKIKSFFGDFHEKGSELTGKISDGIQSARETVKKKMGTVIDKALEKIKENQNAFEEAGENMSEGVAGGLFKATSVVNKAATNVAKSGLEAMKKFLGIRSPAKEAIDSVGKPTGEGVAVGLAASTPGVVESAKTFLGKVMDPLKYGVLANTSFMKEEFSEVGVAITAMSDDAAEAIKKINEAAKIAKGNLTVKDAMEKYIHTQKKQGKMTSALEKEIREGIAGVSKEYADKEVKQAQATATATSSAKTTAAKSALDKVKEYIDEEKFYGRMSLQQEYEEWSKVQSKYKAGSNERKEIDKKLYSLRKEMAREEYDLAMKHIEDEKFYGRMSLAQEIKAVAAIVQAHAEGTDERMAAERRLFELRKDLADRQKQLDEEHYNNSKELLDKKNEDWDAAADKYKQAFDSRVDALKSAYGLFDKVEMPEEPVKGKELLSNLKSQTEAFKNWQIEYNKLASSGAIGDTLLKELSDMGPKALEQLKALNELSKWELEEYNKLYETKAEEAHNQAVEDMAALRKEMVAEQAKITKEFDKAIADNNQKWIDATIELQEGLNEGYSEIGEMIVEEVGDMSSKVTKETNQMTKDVIHTITSQDWPSVGRDMVDGIVDGVHQSRERLVGAMMDIAFAALSAARAALEIESPSRKFAELGRFTTLGFIEGIESLSSGVEKASAEMASQSISPVKKAIETISDILDRDVDMTPTIKPVIDLDDVKKDLATIFANRNISAELAETNAKRIYQTEKQKYTNQDAANNSTTTIVNDFDVKATIREESDIRKVSRELYTLQRSKLRGRRGIPNEI